MGTGPTRSAASRPGASAVPRTAAAPPAAVGVADPLDLADADAVAIGLGAGDGLPAGLPSEVHAALEPLVADDPTPDRIVATRVDGRWWILVGLGPRDRLDPERARVTAARVHGRAQEIRARRLHWIAPGDDALAAALVEGTLLHAYRFDRHRSEPSRESRLERLIVSGARPETVERAAVVAGAVNATRDLQNAPPNHLTPSALGDRARAIAAATGLQVEVHGPEEIVARGMGAFAAVASGSHEEPRLIVLRHAPTGVHGPVLGLVGKAITFDSGGLSLKRDDAMVQMKYDMSGGAAVLEALGAIARLEVPQPVVAVVGATENLPGGGAMRPGDVVTAGNGLTLEVNNTDAEGRLVLAECLHLARELGAERLVDVATLTSAAAVALGSTYAALLANDDDWAAEVTAAAGEAGEPVWRLPLHDEYAELLKGTVGDLNAAPLATRQKAGAIVPAQLLARFVGDAAWAHVDFTGIAWDAGRPYAATGGTGAMTRTLIRLAERLTGA